jgi:lysozyme family protein
MSLPQAIAFVLAKETGELTTDNAGLSRWGISQGSHPELSEDQIRGMTATQAAQIYADHYYPARADELPDYVSIPLLACCVLQGRETGVEILQTALGVHADGSIGPQTISAARLANPRAFLARFVGEQVRHLCKLPGWSTYGIGWVERVTAAVLTSGAS